jgi:hypothetical protein
MSALIARVLPFVVVVKGPRPHPVIAPRRFRTAAAAHRYAARMEARALAPMSVFRGEPAYVVR